VDYSAPVPAAVGARTERARRRTGGVSQA